MDEQERFFEDFEECYSYFLYTPVVPRVGLFRETVIVPTVMGYDFLLRRITVKWGETGRAVPVRLTLKSFEDWRNRTFEPVDITVDLISTPGQVAQAPGGGLLAGVRKLHKTVNYLWARRTSLTFWLEGWATVGAADLPGQIDVLLEGAYIRVKGGES